VLASANRDACVITADVPHGLLGSYHANRESARTRHELGASASIGFRQSRLIQLGQAFVEASDAICRRGSRFVDPMTTAQACCSRAIRGERCTQISRKNYGISPRSLPVGEPQVGEKKPASRRKKPSGFPGIVTALAAAALVKQLLSRARIVAPGESIEDVIRARDSRSHDGNAVVGHSGPCAGDRCNYAEGALGSV